MLTVGPGGSYATINAAIAAAGPLPDEIRLLSGFVMQEQVLLDQRDLNHLTITADDPVVMIDPAAITQYLLPLDDGIPAFGGIGGSRLPVIGALFEYPVNTSGKDGVSVSDGSSVRFKPGAGVRKSRRGLRVLSDSRASCFIPTLTNGGASPLTGVDFSYAKNRALHVGFGSHAALPRSNFSHNDNGPNDDDAAVYIIWGSHVDLYQSNVSYALGEAIYVRDGSTCCARDTNVSHSRIGYHALHGASIDARSKRDSNPWVGEGARYCSANALVANGSSTIEAPEIIADDCGGTAILADSGSHINIEDGTAMRSQNGAILAIASDVNMMAATVSSLTADAVTSNRGSRISARDSSAGAPGGKVGFRVSNGSIIAANGTTGSKSQALNTVAAAGTIFG